MDKFINVTDVNGDHIRINSHYIVSYKEGKNGHVFLTVKSSIHNDIAPLELLTELDILDFLLMNCMQR